MSISLRADSATDIEATITSLTNGSGRELGTDLHVVHRWRQSGLGVFQGPPVEVDELLLKDDRVSLRDGYTRRCASPLHLHRSKTRYLPPSVRLSGPVETTIAGGTTKQLWITVQVPADAVAGEYGGSIRIRSSGKVHEIGVTVDVIPVTLADPAQDLMIWYRGTINCHHPQHYVSPRILETQLGDIKSHGFTSISLWETDYRQMQYAVDVAQSVGFNRYVVIDGYNANLWERVDFGRLTPVAYVSDELDSALEGKREEHVRRLRAARAAGARTMASLLRWESGRELAENGDTTDVISLFAPDNRGRLALSQAAQQDGDARTYYYWHAHMEKPLVHRALAGLLLWKSGADGISPYCYQHLPGAPWSPYDDFDLWDPATHADKHGRTYRDHMATYPARGGAIPTLQWKGMADGITDLRYLITLDEAIRRRSGNPDIASRIERQVASIVSWLDVEILSDANPLPDPRVTGDAVATLRSEILDALLVASSG